MVRKLFVLFCVLGLLASTATAVKMGVHQVTLLASATPTDSTFTLGTSTGSFSCFAYGDTVSFQLYNRNLAFIATITVPDGASISFDDGPLIKKVTINRPATAPLAVFTALQ